MNLLYYILNKSPFIHYSIDKNFDTIEVSNLNEKMNLIRITESSVKLRLSVIGLQFGTRRIYIFTYCDGKLELYHSLRLDSFFPLKDFRGQIEKQRAYLDNVSNLNDRKDELDFIKYRIESETNRVNTASNKMTSYYYIFQLLFPLYFAYVLYFLELDLPNYANIIFLFVLGYYVVNMYLYNTDFLKVKSFKRSRYADLKNSKRKSTDVFLAYYSDWQNIKYEADWFVTYPKNIQKIYKRLFFVMLISFALVLFPKLSFSNINTHSIVTEKAENVITLNWVSNRLTLDSLNQLQLIQSDLLVVKSGQILIIGPISDDGFDDNLEQLRTLITPFNVNELEVLYLNDNTLKNNEVKIIILGG